MIFFISDTHFFHDKLSVERGFKSTDEMNALIFDNWNRVVKKDDVVYHLGDVGWKTQLKQHETLNLLRQLNGTKILVKGNHDSPAVVNMPVWKRVNEYKEFLDHSLCITLFHFPLASWNRKAYGSYNFHGHMHGTYVPLPRQLDVGVDANNFTPISLEDALLKAKDTGVHDGNFR